MRNMRFKVGDKVRLKGTDVGGIIEDEKRGQYVVQIFNASKIVAWPEDLSLIEGLVEEKPLYKALVDKDGYMTGEFVRLKETKQEITCPDGYIFKDENGNVINAMKIVLEKKKKEYPKTYEECLKVLGIEGGRLMFNNSGITQYERELYIKMNNLSKLLICRDAYWKIAGDEMGLGKPWKPSDSDYITGRYCIFVHRGNILCDTPAQDCILTFPTEEMRDAFYENFKELINEVKELL